VKMMPATHSSVACTNAFFTIITQLHRIKKANTACTWLRELRSMHMPIAQLTASHKQRRHLPVPPASNGAAAVETP
jgi:hypothetical protein